MLRYHPHNAIGLYSQVEEVGEEVEGVGEAIGVEEVAEDGVVEVVEVIGVEVVVDEVVEDGVVGVEEVTDPGRFRDPPKRR